MTQVAISRRDALRLLGVGAAGAAAAPVRAAAVEHAEHPEAAPDAVSMLYDTTLCTGCKACMSACNEANHLPPDTRLSGGLWQMPLDLNDRTMNIIKLYDDPASGETSFVKQQCMHCLDPACVSGCPFGALEKSDWGVVTWDGSRCIGCRYCEVACPFHVPKFEWEDFNPEIVKCQFCYHRLQVGQQPGCTTACPTGAVIFGKRDALLARAKDRIAEQPGKYFENRVYGEHDAGGTQVLYLSHVDFRKIGLPDVPQTSIPWYATRVSAFLYRWLLIPAAVYAVFTAIIRRNWKRHEAEAHDTESETNVRGQL